MNRKEVAKKIYDHKGHIDTIWNHIQEQITTNKYVSSELSIEHNRISVLAPKVDNLIISNKNLSLRIEEVEDLAKRLLAILQRSGILEEVVYGEDLFQMQSTLDTLRRYPLYRVNKVQIK